MIRLQRIAILVVIVMWGAPIAFADAPSSGWTLKHTEQVATNSPANTLVKNSGFLKRYPVFVDDITSDQQPSKLKLTPKQYHQAAVWGLTPAQEKRYVFLMQNRSGVYYRDKHLSPVEVLGLNARTNTERQAYAKLAAGQEAQYIAKNLGWASAFHAQYVGLMQSQNMPVLRDFPVKSFSPMHYTPVVLDAHDHLLFFTNFTTPVKPIMASLLRSLQHNNTIKLDIYFVGKMDRDGIEHWALLQNIPPKMVRAGQIKLHRGIAAYGKLPKTPILPALYLVREGKSKQIDTGRF